MFRLRLSLCIFFIYTMGLCFSITPVQETPNEEDDKQECDRLSPSYKSLPRGAQIFRVRSVYDGDTLTLADDRRVRLKGIDTPELKPLQPFATDAKSYTQSRCQQKDIWLVVDGKDHYQRLLGHVFVRDKSSGDYLCINEGLVHEGFATVYAPKKAAPKTFHNWDKLIHLQKDARESGRGMWKSFRDTWVYKTKHGSAYHKKSCTHLSKSNLERVKISAALDQGLHPCRTCMS